MEQVLHILKKDVRRLRWEILASLLLTGLLAWLSGDNRLVVPVTKRDFMLSGMRNTLLPLTVGSWWFLIVSLIHEEAIPGALQFWLTRPYRRGALLGAKLLFIALFVNLPAFIADLAVFLRAGVPLAGQLAPLLWKQLLFSGLFLLPAAGLAAITSGLAQTVLGVLGLLLWNSLLSLVPGTGATLGGGLHWWTMTFQLALLFVAGILLLYWQYFRRKTDWSRGLVLALNVGIVTIAWALPLGLVFSWQQRLVHQPGAGAPYSIQPALERGRLSPEPGMRPSASTAQIAIPVEHTLPSGLEMLADGVEASANTLDGKPVAWGEAVAGWMEREGKPWIVLSLPRAEFNRIRGIALRIDVKIYATLFRQLRRTSMRFGSEPQAIEQFGVCGSRESGSSIYAWCRTAFSPLQWTRMTLHSPASGEWGPPITMSGASYAPFHWDAGVSPLTGILSRAELISRRLPGSENGWDPALLGSTEIHLTAAEPLDHPIGTLRFDNIRLEDFEVIEPR